MNNGEVLPHTNFHVLCSHLRPSLVDMLGVSNIVPDRNARARPTSEAVAQFMRRMLKASQLWVGFDYCSLVAALC